MAKRSEFTTTKDYIIAEFSDEEHGDEYARAFLNSGFLGDVADLLFRARKYAKLTQAQLAEKTGKQQDVISRHEADVEGRMTFATFTKLVSTCGFVPRLTLVSFAWAKEEELFKLEHPEAVQLDIRIQKEHASDDVLVSEQRFFAWTDKPTRDAALSELWESMREGLEALSEEENTLGWHLRQQLAYYRELDAAGLL